MKHDIDKILELCKKENYFSFLETELLKSNKEFIKIYEIPLDVIKDNLSIGINSSNSTGKNVENLKTLLNSIKQTNVEYLINVDVTMPNKGLRTIYIDTDISTIYGEL